MQVGDEQEGGRKEDAPGLLLGDRTDGMWCHVSGRGPRKRSRKPRMMSSVSEYYLGIRTRGGHFEGSGSGLRRDRWTADRDGGAIYF